MSFMFSGIQQQMLLGSGKMAMSFTRRKRGFWSRYEKQSTCNRATISRNHPSLSHNRWWLEELGSPEIRIIISHISLLQIKGTGESLFRYKSEPFLIRIVTVNEKWVMYLNINRRRTVYRLSESPASSSKSELYSKKVFSGMWWTLQGIVLWEVLTSNQSIKPLSVALRLRSAL